ncbi:LOW QUALITY PROTEIN: hypothetical protein U9M48_044823, partial [Paspalum notatum var. saurae]
VFSLTSLSEIIPRQSRVSHSNQYIVDGLQNPSKVRHFDESFRMKMYLINRANTRSYTLHGILYELDVVEAERAVHEALAAELDALGGGQERRSRVAQEQGCGNEAQDVDERVPHEQDVEPHPQHEGQEARRERRARVGVHRAPAARSGRQFRQARRVRGAAGAGDEERQQRDAVAEGVVHAQEDGGRCFGGREVEDVELPEWAGVVHGRRGQRRQVVLYGLVWLGRRGGGVQVGDNDVVVQVHRGPHPPRLAVLFHVILHLRCERR